MWATLAPIRHMSFTMCDCIISASSWEWLGVLMKVGLLLGARGSLVPAGTLNLIKTRNCYEAADNRVVIIQLDES